ncbi:MAG: aspartate kinase [Clostridia bacterium]|nr:aspartate kinase [Clostridia bacterium]
MKTVILKFGGSSVADNIKLNVVAQKVISLKKESENVVVVVSAQGKTTDTLIREAQELSAIPEEREMDMLLSTGEQITSAKLSILLNRLGQKAISLTGWQVGIRTSNVHKKAKINEICTTRIKKELEEGKVVIVAGFQGIDENGDITTLGRGGSDTTAVALQAALQADKCYIFSDVDGIYSADPNMITMAKRLDEISFDEMQEIADAGAKVLHNRCIQIGKKFKCNIVAKSTFTEEGGTRVCQEIEKEEVKSIVKNEKLIEIEIENKKKIESEEIYKIYQSLLDQNVITERLNIKEEKLSFIIRLEDLNKTREILENVCKDYEIKQSDITKLTIVGYGITQDNLILNKVVKTLKQENIKIKSINLTQTKIEILLDKIENDVINKLHEELV